MVTNYYTLRALAEAWDKTLCGCIVGDVYSQSRDELTVALAGQDATWLIRASVRAPFQYLFKTEGYNKARRNVATLFRAAFDASVQRIRLAERDRILFVELSKGLRLQFVLFGPRANVYLIDDAGAIQEAFQRNDALAGQQAPEPAPAPVMDTMDAFMARWSPDAPSVVRAVSRVYPFLNAELAREVVFRANILAEKASECSLEDLTRIFTTAQAMHNALLAPRPRIYWRGERAEKLSLVNLQQFAACRAEAFEDIDRAVAVYVRKKLGQAAFDAVYLPLEKALAGASEQADRRLEALLESLSEKSRADRYERWAHLLMASQAAVPAMAAAVELEDLFDENRPVEIPLDPGLSAVENARRFYDKARQTRQARAHAEERLEGVERQAGEAKKLLAALRSLTTRAEVLQFQKENADTLAALVGQKSGDAVEQIPFRRYDLGKGYEVWVGKNARQNDQLTFEYARKFDFWLHARGVAGSHTLLRRPGRTAQPDKKLLEKAAAIAAYHSKARGSQLAPVIVTEKKYVRKPKGAASGAVVVERERVLLVAPGVPSAG